MNENTVSWTCEHKFLTQNSRNGKFITLKIFNFVYSYKFETQYVEVNYTLNYTLYISRMIHFSLKFINAFFF